MEPFPCIATNTSPPPKKGGVPQDMINETTKRRGGGVGGWFWPSGWEKDPISPRHPQRRDRPFPYAPNEQLQGGTSVFSWPLGRGAQYGKGGYPQPGQVGVRNRRISGKWPSHWSNLFLLTSLGPLFSRLFASHIHLHAALTPTHS